VAVLERCPSQQPSILPNATKVPEVLALGLGSILREEGQVSGPEDNEFSGGLSSGQ
jgi:hypothetical protein